MRTERTAGSKRLSFYFIPQARRRFGEVSAVLFLSTFFWSFYLEVGYE